MERRQELLAHAIHEIAAVDEVLLAQREEVSAVAPLGCRGEAEQELRPEVSDELAVGRGRRVVELVDDDVVECLWGEPLQVLAPAQGLDRGEHDVGVWFPGAACVVAKVSLRTNSAERIESLPEDLFTMRDEQNAPEIRAVGVEGREPRLSEPCREDDEAGFVAGGAGLFELQERLPLHLVRLDRRLRRLLRDIDSLDDRP